MLYVETSRARSIRNKHFKRNKMKMTRMSNAKKKKKKKNQRTLVTSGIKRKSKQIIIYTRYTKYAKFKLMITTLEISYTVLEKDSISQNYLKTIYRRGET